MDKKHFEQIGPDSKLFQNSDKKSPLHKFEPIVPGGNSTKRFTPDNNEIAGPDNNSLKPHKADNTYLQQINKNLKKIEK